MADPAAIACQRLVIGHGGTALLPPIDLELRPGTLLVVLGRNGSGKTTWFRTLLGLQRPVSGRIRRKARLRTSYQAQVMSLDRKLPVRARDLVRWGRMSGFDFLRPRPPATDVAAADRALDEAGATALGDQLFGDLSEGQKQRVLLARTLAGDPDCAFLDEPTSAMDVVGERDTMARLCSLTESRGMVTVVVTHVLGVAAEHANLVAFFDRDDQTVVVGAPAAVFADPVFRKHLGVLDARHQH